MLIVKAGQLNITRGLILTASMTMEQRRIPAKETSVHREIHGISTLPDTRLDQVNSHVPGFLYSHAVGTGWKTYRSVQARHHIIDPRPQKHIVRLPHDMLTRLHAIPGEPGKVWRDLRESHQQRLDQVRGARLHPAIDVFPPLVEPGPSERFVGHVRGLEGHFAVEGEPEILSVIMSLECVSDLVHCLTHVYFPIDDPYLEVWLEGEGDPGKNAE